MMLYTSSDCEGHFRHNALFVGGNTRNAVSKTKQIIRHAFMRFQNFFKRQMPVDVAIINVSRPTSDGIAVMVSCDYTKPAAENARIVIAEVNDKMLQ